MTYLAFNLNNHILVLIKPEGFVLWKAHDDALMGFDYRPLSDYTSQADESGYVQMQAWQFCHLFGPHFINGLNSPVENTIILEASTLKPQL